MKLALFASHWTASYGRELPAILDELVRCGFAGLEASLADLGRDAAARRRAVRELQDRGLRLIVGVYSNWVDYEGPSQRQSPAAHLALLQRQLDEAKALDPAHVNVHGGDDAWDDASCAEYYDGAAALLDGVSASHETHRGRPLFHPFATVRHLVHPELRLTLDLSHWHLVCERTLQEDRALLLSNVVPRVDHIHVRLGSEQAPQLPRRQPPSDAVLHDHTWFWRQIWLCKYRLGADEVFATPELGPPPYQTGGDASPAALWDQTLDTAGLIRDVFAQTIPPS